MDEKSIEEICDVVLDKVFDEDFELFWTDMIKGMPPSPPEVVKMIKTLSKIAYTKGTQKVLSMGQVSISVMKAGEEVESLFRGGGNEHLH